MAKERNFLNCGAYRCELWNPKAKLDVTAAHVSNFLVRLMSAFEWKGLPDTIPARYLEKYLLTNGQCYIAEHEGNLYALAGKLGGEPDAYYIPSKYIVANPALNLSKEYDRDKDGILFRNDDLMLGVLPILVRYSTALTENELTMQIAAINMRLAFILSAGDDAAKKSAEIFLKKIADGDLGVIGDALFLTEENGVKVQPGIGSTATGYMSQLIEHEQYLRASCLNECGVDLNFNMKREALNTGETAQNEPALLPLIDNMLKCRKEAAEALNEKYGLSVTVDLASAWELERKEQEESINKEDEPKEGDEDDKIE